MQFPRDDQADRAPMANSAGLLAESVPGDNAPPLSVSELSGALRRVVEDRFGHVRVRGEISGFKRAASGHCYLCLKDEASALDAVIWKGAGTGFAFSPEDGIEVVATGRLTTYPGRSKYQLVIDHLEIAGEGALMKLLDQRRRTLAAEGLFDQQRKRPLPFLPRVIGVVTSPTGAVIRDILHRLADRMLSHVIIWPVIVQGEGAAGQIARAVRGFDMLPPDGSITRPDLVIVARGGGSIEDLWAFNEEVVVRAVAECSIPVISAVGHETDTTLCDFAADVRAPTPTAAAELAVPVRAELLATIAQAALRASCAVRRNQLRAAERLGQLARLLPRRDSLFAPQRQKLDECGDRLPRALGTRLALARAAFERRVDRLRPGLLSARAADAETRLAGLARLLVQLHPDRPLARGYARVEDRDGAVLTSRAAAVAARVLTIRFADGPVDTRVEGGAKLAYRLKQGSQPSLFD